MGDRQAQTLVELIASLPEEERVILTLHLVKRFSLSEIATKLGVPERSVEAVLASARARLTSSISPDSTE